VPQNKFGVSTYFHDLFSRLQQWPKVRCSGKALGKIILLLHQATPLAASALKLENITVTVPVGTNNHRDPHLLCTLSTWTDIASFFLANYMAHAATIRSVPGNQQFLLPLGSSFRSCSQYQASSGASMLYDDAYALVAPRLSRPTGQVHFVWLSERQTGNLQIETRFRALRCMEIEDA